MNDDTRTNYALLRCHKCKARGTVQRLAFEQRRVEQTRYSRGIPGIAGSAEKRTVRAWVTPNEGKCVIWRAVEAFKCTCGRTRADVAYVDGRVDESRRCDTRCQSATTGACECACGGKNHGIAHGG